MAIASWPWAFEPDGVTPAEHSEDEFRWTLAAATQDGIWPDEDDECAVTVAADSTEVTVHPGRGQVRGYGFYVDAEETVAAPANASSDPRLYWVVLRLDRANNLVEADIVEGTAASSPELPNLTRDDDTWELPLYSFRRAGGGGSISNLTDYRCYLNPHGPRKCASTGRPVDPAAGDQVYETDTGRLMRYHDGAWIADSDPTYPTDWTNIPLASGVVAYRSRSGGLGYWPRYRRLSEDEVVLRGTVARSNGAGFQPNNVTLGRLPSGVRPTEYEHQPVAAAQDSDANQNMVRLEVQPDGEIRAWFPFGYEPPWIGFGGFRYYTH